MYTVIYHSVYQKFSIC